MTLGQPPLYGPTTPQITKQALDDVAIRQLDSIGLQMLFHERRESIIARLLNEMEQALEVIPVRPEFKFHPFFHPFKATIHRIEVEILDDLKVELSR